MCRAHYPLISLVKLNTVGLRGRSCRGPSRRLVRRLILLCIRSHRHRNLPRHRCESLSVSCHFVALQSPDPETARPLNARIRPPTNMSAIWFHKTPFRSGCGSTKRGHRACRTFAGAETACSSSLQKRKLLTLEDSRWMSAFQRRSEGRLAPWISGDLLLATFSPGRSRAANRHSTGVSPLQRPNLELPTIQISWTALDCVASPEQNLA